jgi:hypothetical protein
MSTRKLGEATKKLVAGKQYYKCARIKEYECPLWNQNNDKRGSFDESGYEIDHIVEYSKTKDDSIDNLQALCHSCHAVKTKRFTADKKTETIGTFKTLTKIKAVKINKPTKDPKFLQIYCEICSNVKDMLKNDNDSSLIVSYVGTMLKCEDSYKVKFGSKGVYNTFMWKFFVIFNINQIDLKMRRELRNMLFNIYMYVKIKTFFRE